MLASQLCVFDDMAMHVKWRYRTLAPKKLEQLKLSSSPKNATADQFITKITKSSGKCWDHCEKIYKK